MTIYEFADIIHKPILVKYLPNKGWQCHFAESELKYNEGMLKGIFGLGKSPILAIQDYCNKIQGETLVFHAYGDDRQEFIVPKILRSNIMKIIKINGCNICPYVGRSVINYHPTNATYCKVVQWDDNGYGLNLNRYIKEQIYPEWCPLEDNK